MRWIATITTLLITTSAAATPDGDAYSGYEGSADLAAKLSDVSTRRFLHGFRFGYGFVSNHTGPTDSTDPSSPTLSERYDLRTPHQFLIGYELTWRLVGHDWLNVLLLSNVMISGIEQSRFFPSLNAVIGFEIDETFQVGVGVHGTPEDDKPVHMLAAAGWTPRVGDFYLPLHAFFIPDVDGHHRSGVTVGVNW